MNDDEQRKLYDEMRKLPGWGAGVFIGPGAKGNIIDKIVVRDAKYGITSYGDQTIITNADITGTDGRDGKDGKDRG